MESAYITKPKIEYKWNEYTKTYALTKKVQIIGSSTYGAPSHYEYFLLLILFNFYLKSKCDKENIVYFNFCEIAKESGCDHPNGTLNEKIRKALKVLDNTTIYAEEKIKINNIDEESKINTEIFHIFNSCNVYSKKFGGFDEIDFFMYKKNMVEFDEKFIDFFKGNFSNIDYKSYINLNSNLAKKIFPFLNANINKLQYELFEGSLTDAILEKKHFRLKLEKAFQELKRHECIFDYSFDDDGISIKYR